MSESQNHPDVHSQPDTQAVTSVLSAALVELPDSSPKQTLREKLKDAASGISSRLILLSEEEAAHLLGLATDTLKNFRWLSKNTRKLVGPRWTAIGKGTRKQIRYRLSDIETYLDRGETELSPRNKPGPKPGSKRKKETQDPPTN
ncbi:MAG: helix-turn-helix domain-containing protein [Alphaproteobacteria bacterium]|nr:helix-turn-helix domain-containing protein [Alphaproteobacteria bacterium]